MLRSTKLLILAIAFLVSGTFSYMPGYKFQTQRETGNFSDWISAQSDLGDFPSHYFLCGIALRQSLWTMLLYNCDCGPKFHNWWISYRCNWCQNHFWTQVNAVKLTFCSANNWNMQQEKQFDTGNPNYREWRQVKCPPGQYASKITGKLGLEFGIDLGLVGVQIKCQNLNFTQSTMVQDSYTYRPMELSKNKQGTFVSAVSVKYVQKQKIFGLRWNFQSVAIISRIKAVYEKTDKVETKSSVIESTSVVNRGPMIIQKTVIFSKPYVITNKYTNSLDFISKYAIKQGVAMPLVSLSDKNGEYSIYSQKTEEFKFGKELKTTYEPNQQVLVLVDSSKAVTVSTVIEEKKVRWAYEAFIEFSDIFTSEMICERGAKGILEGTVASSIKSVIVQEPVPK